MMTYLILSGLLLVGALSGLIAFRLMRSEKKIFERMHLMLRAVHVCASQVQKVDKRLEEMQAEERAAFEFHRRANERQRVMLASLNRQIQHIETMVGDRNLTSAKNAAANVHDVAGKDAPVQSRAALKSAAGSAGGHVTLEDMFRTHGGSNVEEVVRRHRMQAQTVRAETPATRSPVAEQMRRVVNG